MAPHSSTLAWKIPWMEEPGMLQSTGSRRVRHDWVTSLYFSLSCIGEGNGNPLQCSCLENPRDSGAWWAAIYGVAQSQTRLKRLSSSSSMSIELMMPSHTSPPLLPPCSPALSLSQLQGLFQSFQCCYCSVAQWLLTLCDPMICSVPATSPSLSPRVCSHSCPLSQWCHPTISSSVALFSSIFPSMRVFSNESSLHIRLPKN